jgi:hypothetical protein
MSDSQPKLSANRVIHQLVQHTVSENLTPSAMDYMVMRIAFRKIGGSWEALFAGDQKQMNLLKFVVGSWGQMPSQVQDAGGMV